MRVRNKMTRPQDHIPDGRYKFRILESILLSRKEIGITFEASMGLSLHQIFTVDQTMEIRNLLESCGDKVPNSMIKLNVDNLPGKWCGARVTTEGTGSVIKEFFPASDMGNYDFVPSRIGEFTTHTLHSVIVLAPAVEKVSSLHQPGSMDFRIKKGR